METIELPTSLPNVSFSLIRDGHVFVFTLRSFRGITYCSCAIDGTTIFVSERCVNNQNLIPEYLEKVYGKFYFADISGAYPYYENFNRNCKFYYESP